jgi:hypothetical protein
MEFSLINAGLAAGAAMAVVPLILHLLMRQTPKRVIFPALRLIRERQKQSKKRLRVKNWLLLLARMAIIALMALALARPNLTTESSVGGGDEIDTAIAIIVDTSASMEYVEKGNNRLKEAQLRAADILKRATDRSEIFVINSSEPTRPAPVSPALGLKQLEAMTLRDTFRPINASVVQALDALEASKLPRREIYVMTDLARSAWDTASSAVAERITKANATKDKKVACYVLRLTPKDIKDVAIVEAEPASAVATQGERMEIKTRIRSFGPKTTRVVELRIDKLLKEQKPIEIPENGEVEISFLTPNALAPGVHQGEVGLSGESDFMTFDDRRYFSYTIQPAQRVLLVSDMTIDALFVQNLLEPDTRDLREGLPQLFKVDRLLTDEFSRKNKNNLKDYSCVFLLNVGRLSEADWGGLNNYVREGGGLVIGLGKNVIPESYNGPNAAQLLPAKTGSIKLTAPETFFAKPEMSHPIFNRYARDIDAEMSRQAKVYRAWSVTPQAGRTILSMTDGSPALLERTFTGAKTGHVLLWTTPLGTGRYGNDTVGWNEFPNSWSFMVMLEIVGYVAGTTSEKLNYEAGEDAILTIDPARRANSYSVSGPKAEERVSVSVPLNTDKLIIPSPQTRGSWTVEGKAADGSDIKMGFSVNVPEGESTASSLEEKDLNAIFGTEENVHLVDDATRIKDFVDKIRVGRELFPWIMFLILIIVTLENLLANKFHREKAAA